MQMLEHSNTQLHLYTVTVVYVSGGVFSHLAGLLDLEIKYLCKPVFFNFFNLLLTIFMQYFYILAYKMNESVLAACSKIIPAGYISQCEGARNAISNNIQELVTKVC